MNKTDPVARHDVRDLARQRYEAAAAESDLRTGRGTVLVIAILLALSSAYTFAKRTDNVNALEESWRRDAASYPEATVKKALAEISENRFLINLVVSVQAFV